MAGSPVYKSALLYEAVMLKLYGRHYFARYRTIADLIPERSTVVDVCCGPAILYTRYLRSKNVQYTGLDVSRPFIQRVQKAGGRGLLWNVRDDAPLPEAEYVVMHASLMHFLPDARPVLERMLRAARRRVIVAEPIRNMASSRATVLAAIARRLTDPGDGGSALRFTEETLDELFSEFSDCVADAFYVPGEREKVFVLEAPAAARRTNTAVWGGTRRI